MLLKQRIGMSGTPPLSPLLSQITTSFAGEAGSIDYETYREINGVETLEASQDLGSLRDAGLLAQHERSTVTYYELTEKLLGAESTAQGGITFEETESENTQAGGESDQAEEESPKLSGETTQADIEPTQAEEQPAPKEEKLPNEIQALLDEWNGKGSPEELRRVILRLCEWKPLSAMEIAQYVQRERRYLMRNYIRTLVEEGALERTRPDAPRSPNQKYRVPPADAEG